MLEEKRRVEKHWKTIARAYASQWTDEVLDEDLSPSDYVDAVDSLCAVSRIQQLVNPDRNNPDALWKTLLDFAHKIAKEMVPGISSRTGALAEVAETANMLRESRFAAYIFEEMHRFIHDRLNSFPASSVVVRENLKTISRKRNSRRRGPPNTSTRNHGRAEFSFKWGYPLQNKL